MSAMLLSDCTCTNAIKWFAVCTNVFVSYQNLLLDVPSTEPITFMHMQ